MAYHEAAQGFIECVPIQGKSIRVGKIDDGAFRFVIAGSRAAFRMLVYRVPVPIEIGGQRQEIGLALLAAAPGSPSSLGRFPFSDQSMIQCVPESSIVSEHSVANRFNSVLPNTS